MVAELIGEKVFFRILVHQFPSLPDGTVGSLFSRGEGDGGSECFDHLSAFEGNGGTHNDLYRVSFDRTDHCETNTGVAGPSGATAEKPVGLFYIGLSHKGGTESRKYRFQGNREQNKCDAAKAALSWLKEYLINLNDESVTS